MHVRRIALLGLLALFATPSSTAIPLDRTSSLLEMGRTAPGAHNMTQLLSGRHGTQRFACVQPPSACESNSDCTCSSCCGDLAGVHVCQPTC